MAYTKEEWQKAKVLRESGKSLSEVELLTGINKSSIQRKEKKENWIVGKTQQLKSDIIEVEKQNATILQQKATIREKIATLEDYEIKYLDEIIQDEAKIRSLLFSTTALNVIRINEDLQQNMKYEKVSCGDGVQNLEPVKLSASDYKNAQEALDKASITLGINQRHSNSQININNENTNAQQNNINIEWE
ncbi:hypothetical protein [Aliarcobacter cryaerophilus]|uniref:hypothetical protein n=1 Tax=Aliarcobacter cryaerophilus TaxID=28198 RepID=UPI000825257B|nr:hypothetical protein [Aliarcobacter cryaerophilus]